MPEVCQPRYFRGARPNHHNGKGRIIFVELKTETGRLAKIQRYTIGEMQKRGADVRVVKGIDAVKELLAEIGGMQG